jgi:broad specificity phosphatase PhoE
MELIDLRKSEPVDKAEIWLLRHGKTAHNQPDDIARFAGKRVDTPLSDEGISQTKALADELIKLAKFDLILTSSMARAIQTGEIIKQRYLEAGIGIPQEIIENFEEIDTGDFTELTELEARRLDPTAAQAFYDADFNNLAFPNGERTEDLKSRVKLVQSELSKINARKILLVGHGMFNRFMIWLFYQNQTKLWQERSYSHDRVIKIKTTFLE